MSYFSQFKNASNNELDYMSINDQQSMGIKARVTITQNTVGFGASLALDSTNNQIIEACADSTSVVIPCHWIAIESGTGTNKEVLIKGYIRNDTWSLTSGFPIYVSKTSGMITQTMPNGDGDYVQLLGYAVSTNIIYFDPDKTYMTLSS